MNKPLLLAISMIVLTMASSSTAPKSINACEVLKLEDATRIAGTSMAQKVTTAPEIKGGVTSVCAYQGTQLSVDGTNLSGNKSAGIYASGAFVTISNAKLDNGVYGLWGGGGSTKLRNCEIKNNKSGISWDVTSSALDLGKSGDIGNNVIQANTTTGLEVSNVANASGTAQAVGNLWAVSQQGASAQGKYASALVTGPTSGLNYSLPNANTKIQF
jgi:hypothetical protein